MRPGMETLELPGASLRVRRAGEGPRALVLCTDPPNVLEHYGPLLARIKQERGLSTYVFEPAGFGQSRLGRGQGHGLDDSARSVVALLERLGVRDAVLAFPCVAAYVALRVASERPDLVAGLVLLQAPAWREEERWIGRVDRRGILRTPLLGQAVGYVRAEAIVRRWYAAAAGTDARGAQLAAFALEALDHGARLPLAGAFQALFRGPSPSLAPVACPTLALWGCADRTHARSDPASVREHAPGATLERLEGVGHFPELEDPAGFTRLVASWMRRHALLD